jgi:F420-dependent oxidoreductase-like protein
MKISLNLTNHSWPDGIAGLRSVVRAADDGGLDTIWLPDHLLQADPTSSPDAEMFEAGTTLGFLAGQTERSRLGTMVSAVAFRPPAVLIKAVTTLDVLSDGRAWFAVGAGWATDEAAAMGIPMGSTRERFEQLEELLQLADRMWSGDDSPYEGSHYRLERPICSPRPVRRPPVLIGGMGEHRTLRLVARYGDACNLFDIPDGGKVIRHKLEVLARHCGEVGRSYDAISKTISTRLEEGGPVEQFVQRCAAFAELGLDHAVVIRSGPWTDESVATLVDAVPSVRDL